jgi:hypothetical protein
LVYLSGFLVSYMHVILLVWGRSDQEFVFFFLSDSVCNISCQLQLGKYTSLCTWYVLYILIYINKMKLWLHTCVFLYFKSVFEK